jgi:hypothetical protein
MTAMQVIAGAPLQEPTFADRAVRIIVELIALVLPSLDHMAQTAWLLGPSPGMAVIVGVLGQTAIYLLLIGTASLFDLYRRNF